MCKHNSVSHLYMEVQNIVLFTLLGVSKSTHVGMVYPWLKSVQGRLLLFVCPYKNFVQKQDDTGKNV